MSTSEEKDVMDLIEDNNKHIPADEKCSKCGTPKSQTRLCASTGDFNIVPFGTEGSWIECYDSVDCRKRGGVHKNKSETKEVSKFETGFGHQYDMGTFKSCRHYATEVFSIGDVKFYGGSESKVEDQSFDSSWLVVSLLGHKTWNVKEYLWAEKKEFVAKLKPFVKVGFEPNLTIDWMDGQAPPVKPGFWVNLIALAAKAGYKNILFYCVGGHGRTGSALASVLVECSDLTAFQAVTLIRKDYCGEAVETKSQVEYLEKLQKTLQKEKTNG